MVVASSLLLLQFMHFVGELTSPVMVRPLVHLSTLKCMSPTFTCLDSMCVILAPLMLAGLMKSRSVTGPALLVSLVPDTRIVLII